MSLNIYPNFNLADAVNFRRKEFEFLCGRHRLRLGKTTKIMGILNVSNDSFSHDGIYKQPHKAKDYALKMIAQGADIIDIGGESTRPGAQPVAVDEELKRVIPVIRALAGEIAAPVSIDTTKATVAELALQAGAAMVNDISGLKFDPRMAEVVARSGAGCVLMHIKGRPPTMQESPFYRSLIEEIIGSLETSIARARAAGVAEQRLLIDPGIGFGKTTEHNLQLIKHLSRFTVFNLPILIGTSRKSFIGNVLNQPVERRMFGSCATIAASILNGAHIVRVHDVKEAHQTAEMVDAILNS